MFKINLPSCEGEWQSVGIGMNPYESVRLSVSILIFASSHTPIVTLAKLLCLALKKVDTKVNENEDKKSEDTEWQEKDKP